MTTNTYPQITPRNIISFADDVALATSTELAAWFGVDPRYGDTMAAAAGLVDGGGGTWTIPEGLDYRDHLDALAKELDLDAEVKVGAAAKPLAPAKKKAPPRNPKPVVVTTQAPALPLAIVDPVAELATEDEGPARTGLAAAFDVPAKSHGAKPLAPGAYCEIIPRGTRGSQKYTAQDPSRPGVITHYQGGKLSPTPAAMPTFKWAVTDQDGPAVVAAWDAGLQAMQAVIDAQGPAVDWYDTYHHAYSAVSKSRGRAKGKG